MEPEPNWRSMYEEERHGRHMLTIKYDELKKKYERLKQDFIRLAVEHNAKITKGLI